MDYRTAEQIRKKGLTGTLTDKLLSGGSVTSSVRESIGEIIKAKSVGLKQKFDPMNIAKVLTGGSNITPALVGRLLGKSSEDISFFSGMKGKNPDYTTLGNGRPVNLRSGDSHADVLAKLYRFMESDIKFREEHDKDIDKYKKQLSDDKERRNEELIMALVSGKDIRKTKKQTDLPWMKYGILGTIGLGAMLYSSDVKAMAKKFTDDANNMINKFDAVEMFKTIIFGEKQKGIKLTSDQADRQNMVYNAFIDAGLSEKQAMAMTSEVGREGGYKEENLFGEHIDPANKAKNLGMLSWQGQRRENVLSELRSKGLIESEDVTGIKLKKGQETLNVMAKYSVGEMRRSEPGKKFLSKTDISREESIEPLGQFIGWRYADPKYGPEGIKRSKSFYQELESKLSKQISFSYDGVSPVENGKITSDFGMRKHPILGAFRQHEGVDIAAKEGSPVKSVAAGTVSLVEKNKAGYGNIVEVDHGGGQKTRYAHLSKIQVDPGQQVTAGQAIGTVGSTGLSTGPHLHFETLHNNKQVDPKVSLGTTTPPEIPKSNKPQKMSTVSSPVILSQNSSIINTHRTTHLLPPTVDDTASLMVKQYG